MKTLNIWLENEEYKILIKSKGDLSWHDYLIVLAESYEKRKEK